MKPEKASKLLFYTVIPEVKEVPWSPEVILVPQMSLYSPKSHFGTAKRHVRPSKVKLVPKMI